jgi:hypothetical protein
VDTDEQPEVADGGSGSGADGLWLKVTDIVGVHLLM